MKAEHAMILKELNKIDIANSNSKGLIDMQIEAKRFQIFGYQKLRALLEEMSREQLIYMMEGNPLGKIRITEKGRKNLDAISGE